MLKRNTEGLSMDFYLFDRYIHLHPAGLVLLTAVAEAAGWLLVRGDRH